MSEGPVTAYLADLPPERAVELTRVRELVRAALPVGYDEGILHGMIAWFVPPARCARTYNGEPLMVAALASQKGHAALYLMGVYGDDALRAALEEAYRVSGRKLDMGKSCLRFQAASELPSTALRSVLAAVSVDELIARHDRAHAGKRLKPVRS